MIRRLLLSLDAQKGPDKVGANSFAKKLTYYFSFLIFETFVIVLIVKAHHKTGMFIRVLTEDTFLAYDLTAT